ncbi:N-acetylmuramoyl-L-alanine amidase-like domain-containing protein [Limibacter armeniacum]|uniref:N-acetylmuramoyl-L-alanine amidase-like domain-containing protein n=1 Tax=Limibacter armeniacum TaxID=466084 RepID=UPI002FE53D8C
MIKKLILVAACMGAAFQYTIAQQLVCPAEDKAAFTEKMEVLARLEVNRDDAGEISAQVGKTFLGMPYVAKTLEVGEEESLVVNLHGLDCTTYLENVLAFTLMVKEGTDNFDRYAHYLEEIRYRDGKLDGYPSRLHYFSEWLADNEEKGFIKNVTKEIGGEPFEKKIDFMSTHRSSYPFLATNDDNFKAIQDIEESLNGRTLYFIPKEKLSELESGIENGDLIAITTSIKGLDITHVGIAVKRGDRIHLMHASTVGQVVVSDMPLADYLQKYKRHTGVMVGRIQ